MVNVSEIQPYERLRFEQAIEWFRNKVSLPSEAWDALIDKIQAWAFSLAGVESALVLQAVQDKLTEILENRLPDSEVDSFRSFADTFQETMQKAGYGKQKPWRTALVFSQNQRTAYGVGRHQQALELRDRLPYVQWWHGHPMDSRPAHLALHKKVFPADSPIAQTILPSAFFCTCKWHFLSERDVEREGLKVEEPPAETVRVKDRITGEVKELPALRVNGRLLPIVEPGFDRTVQQTLQGREQILESALQRLSPSLRKLAEQQINLSEPLEFAAKFKGKPTVARSGRVLNCKSGNYQCGGACIQGSRRCRKDFDSERLRTAQEWLKNQSERTQSPQPKRQGKKTDFAQEWEGSWENAPQDLIEVHNLIDQPEAMSEEVVKAAGIDGACHGNGKIHMAEYAPNGEGRDQAVWRHEYGHHLDNEFAVELGRRRLSAEFQKHGFKDSNDFYSQADAVEKQVEETRNQAVDNALGGNVSDADMAAMKAAQSEYDRLEQINDEVSQALGINKVIAEAGYSVDMLAGTYVNADPRNRHISSTQEANEAFRADEEHLLKQVALDRQFHLKTFEDEFDKYLDVDSVRTTLGLGSEQYDVLLSLPGTRETVKASLDDEAKARAGRQIARIKALEQIQLTAKERMRQAKVKSNSKKYQAEYTKQMQQAAREAVEASSLSPLHKQLFAHLAPVDATQVAPILLSETHSPETMALLTELAFKSQGQAITGMADDLIGSITYNVVGAGHSKQYYDQDPVHYRNTESFANIIAIYGSGHPQAEQVLQLLSPNGFNFVKDMLRRIADG